MASRIFSIRLDDRVVEALEALQSPDDDSLNTTLKRFVIDSLGIDVNSLVHTVNNDEKLQDLIDNKTAYLADAMNEVKSQLENQISSLKSRVQSLEASSQVQSTSPVTTKTTSTDDALIKTAIAPKATPQDVVLSQAGRPLSAGEIKSKVNSIARTLADKGCEISRSIIRGKILAMYPNFEDWLSDDARKEVIRALEK